MNWLLPVAVRTSVAVSPRRMKSLAVKAIVLALIFDPVASVIEPMLVTVRRSVAIADWITVSASSWMLMLVPLAMMVPRSVLPEPPMITSLFAVKETF